MRIILFFCYLFVGIQINAQSNLAIGEWRSLLPYTVGKYVTQTPTEVWFAADRSILIFDKEEMSTSNFDKIDGLSDVDIKSIAYNEGNNLFLVAYENSNIDIISGSTKSVYNMNDIKRDIELQGDKTIYDIYFLNDVAYLATGFGVMKIDLINKEINFTTFTNLPVQSITVWNNQIYAATDEGIYFAPLNNFNLLDFTAWGKLDIDDGFPDDYSSRVVHEYNNELFVDVNDTLFIYANNTLDFVLYEEEYSINYLQDGQNALLINIQKFPFHGQKIYLKTNENLIEEELPSWCLSGSGSSAVQDEQGRIWIADFGGRFIVYNPSTGNCSKMDFNSPYSVFNARFDIMDDVLWVTGGNIDQGWQYGLNKSGLAAYENGFWSIYNQETEVELDGMLDMIDVEINQQTGVVYVGSFIRGLVVYGGEEFVVHNTTNSPLATVNGDTPGNCRVPGIAIDQQGNVWMANNGVNQPVAVLKVDGTWETYSVSNKSLIDPTIDAVGNKWFTTADRGITVFKEDDVEGGANHQSRDITVSNSALPSDIIYDISLDLDNDVWVGTSEGIIIFECGSDVFSSSCQGTARIVEREDGNNARLMESENVKCIAIDGANRKWVGTNNGVFLLSDDGLEEIFHFTTENSPLFSNVINDVKVNSNSGEVYIGTEDGIISYQGDATVGKSYHSNVYTYPNPVKEDYDGPIAIRGLPQNATVKITDINGLLIYETTANGGQAIWDGKDYNGRSAASGVYLVFSVNENNLENPDGFVSKILIID